MWANSKKRRLMGSEIYRALNATNNQKENASVYIRSEVNRLMKEGELCIILNYY